MNEPTYNGKITKKDAITTEKTSNKETYAPRVSEMATKLAETAEVAIILLLDIYLQPLHKQLMQHHVAQHFANSEQESPPI